VGPRIEVWPEGLSEQEGKVRAQAAIEIPGQERFVLWFDVAQAHAGLLAETCDPFPLALLFTAMSRGEAMHVHGKVSPSLLRNLGELSRVWHSWTPKRCAPVDLSADAEARPPWAGEPRGTVMGFSGGADSSFTAWRHRAGQAGPRTRKIDAALMVHGFDIPLERESEFERAVAKARAMLDSISLPLLTMATNVRALRQRWTHSWAVSLVACLALFQRAYSTILVADEFTPDWTGPSPCGPQVEKLMSCDAFEVVSDGSPFERVDKLRELAQWPEAMRHLRVCYEAEPRDRNCGKCGKCIRTILCFRAAGVPLPECFERDITTRDILGRRRLREESVYLYRQLLAVARKREPHAAWVRALGYVVLRGRLRFAWRAARERVRDLLKRAVAPFRPKRPPARDSDEP